MEEQRFKAICSRQGRGFLTVYLSLLFMSTQQNKITRIWKTLKQEAHNTLSDFQRSGSVQEHEAYAGIVGEIKSKGFVVLPRFFDTAQCDQWKQEIDRLIETKPDRVTVDAQYSDHRIHHADALSDSIRQFYDHLELRKIVEMYEQCSIREGFTLAAKLVHQPTNLGSGGGWHRDSAAHRQTKAIVYLTDVFAETGPFQYIEQSHTSLSVLSDQVKNDRAFNQYRFEEKEVQSLISKDPKKLRTVCGLAGSVIIVDTRGIHRGMPIETGTRYALTNYLWFETPMPPHMQSLMVDPN